MSNISKLRRLSDLKEQINVLYWGEGLTIKETALRMGSNSSTIYRAMILYGISTRPSSVANRLSKIGGLNPMWKGNAIDPQNGRCRAQRMYSTQPCHICGKRGERHHVDRNLLNNETKNIEWLCRKHHMIADGRYEKWIRFISLRSRRHVE